MGDETIGDRCDEMVAEAGQHKDLAGLPVAAAIAKAVASYNELVSLRDGLSEWSLPLVVAPRREEILKKIGVFVTDFDELIDYLPILEKCCDQVSHAAYCEKRRSAGALNTLYKKFQDYLPPCVARRCAELALLHKEAGHRYSDRV